METKEIALIGAGVAAFGGIAFLAKRALQKRAINKAITPELVATAQQAMDMSRQNANNQLIATLKARAAQQGAQQSPLEKSFDALYNSITVLLDFDARWKNGTDYFNGAMTVGLAKGNMAKSIGDCGRRLILIGSDHGTVVLFERYTLGHGPFVVVNNSASQLRDLIPNGSLDNDQFITITTALTA